MADTRPVLLAAGGTGGHLFPAEALAAELAKRGVPVDLITDPRAKEYAGNFPARAVYAVDSATFGSKNPLAIFKAAAKIGLGFGESARLIRKLKPRALVGFGGYPSLPPLLAGQLLGVPTIIHEQNAVMGRANRILAPRATRIGMGFPNLTNAKPGLLEKATHVGNPVREAVRTAASTYAAPEAGGPIRLLSFGGSQGARIMSVTVPPAIAALEPELRARLKIVQQSRPEDLEHAEEIYRKAGVKAELSPFFRDLPQRMADAHLVIARSGASTVAELCVIGRPSFLVPLPHSLDNDQLENARSLEAAGGGTLVPQAEFTPANLARLLTDLLAKPQTLSGQAKAASAYARPDAAARLADLVLEAAP
ncbi:UDP-N-acetylglucosamine--N-acetylmuramyl-(pentapeptide) pyrophosphoryl-undecaprenol N-acetylglucosamine transferase [Terrihabitans soli]|uniref:UDP-N-acetylglucosamine--N-acetylmuramyl-(pentapeptide) pyrophosphoryl-undecaprenol N-acetylglucosamine transferase n=1 Tax=Terrihabitans soli TaxID=708113 RepID=A0A6S6QJF6_9HYPH|nr:undecaprenyldiphospho-muramoylpentapeptide beta-N-acetylglucosaminyltransferase [Terrihabitans soli]BCJ91413.1 UDP-N-acetylglucosamine--N-acetylmuramyl-(pentapeptide) pyrophosphoryl-undecaprenol N-acetylglucosamine transferase [Terrihabitans soli]